MMLKTGIVKKNFAGTYLPLGLCIFLFTLFSLNTKATTETYSAKSAENSTVVADTNISTTATPEIVAVPATTNLSNARTGVPPPQKISSASQLASLLGGLVLIVGLIYGLSWFVKRFSQGGFLQNSTIKILSAMPLGTRERIMLVDVGGKQILLGVTATQINTLHVFDESVVNPGTGANAAPSDFSQKLMSLLQKSSTEQKASAQADLKK